MYIQPDFASGGQNFAQIRDAYFDLGLDEKQEFRLRIGQSKVPFGFENLQESQNRIPLDRNDGLNSAVLNERDIGVFFYYALVEIRERIKYLVSSGLKGFGDYGMYMKKTTKGAIIPLTRYHYYAGGEKFELDATRHRVNELEIGVEWQFHKALELVTMYTISDRSAQNSRDPFNRERGSLLRIQAQVNF